jgi:hypothetical protein
MPQKKTSKRASNPLPKITKKAWFVRKRDKTVVYIDSVGKVKVSYVTMPLLVVYAADLSNFHKNFRPATAEEIAPHKDYLV